jgi:hypothetical protein
MDGGDRIAILARESMIHDAVYAADGQETQGVQGVVTIIDVAGLARYHCNHTTVEGWTWSRDLMWTRGVVGLIITSAQVVALSSDFVAPTALATIQQAKLHTTHKACNTCRCCTEVTR